MSKKIHELSAMEMIQRYEKHDISPVEVVQAVIDRMNHCEPQIQAVWWRDDEAALIAAHASQARWLRNEPIGVLDGVTVTLKENIATRGVPVPLGSASTELIAAKDDAPTAARLKEAGAIIVGKTTMPDFGFLGAAPSSFHPLTRNPWDLSRNTGGSSSGAGAAAAACYGPVHIGTDIGGSVRIPASFCGVFGFKPTQGRVPVFPPAAARVIGPMTRTVDDAALTMQVISRPDTRDYSSLPIHNINWQDLERTPKGLRIGLWIDPWTSWTVDPEVHEAVMRAAQQFRAAGAQVESLPDWITPEMHTGLIHFFTMRCRVDLANLPPECAALAAPYIHHAAQLAADLSPEDTFCAFTRLQKLRAATVAATQAYDYVISPVSPVLPFAAEAISSGGEPLKDAHFTSVFNQSEQPAASICCGFSASGLPIGLQIAGRRFDDLGVLQMAKFFESTRTDSQIHWPLP
jgi:aspartyl-tRNA(Asn)/glutamyl-tRNA(Gln) amidotransferase subunit A